MPTGKTQTPLVALAKLENALKNSFDEETISLVAKNHKNEILKFSPYKGSTYFAILRLAGRGKGHAALFLQNFLDVYLETGEAARKQQQKIYLEFEKQLTRILKNKNIAFGSNGSGYFAIKSKTSKIVFEIKIHSETCASARYFLAKHELEKKSWSEIFRYLEVKIQSCPLALSEKV